MTYVCHLLFDWILIVSICLHTHVIVEILRYAMWKCLKFCYDFPINDMVSL